MLAALLFLTVLPEDKPVKFTEYDGYHVHNGNIKEGDRVCFALRNRPTLERIIAESPPPNMGKVLDKDAFERELAIIYIRRGEAVWTYEVESLTADGDALTVKFRSKSSSEGGGSFACPMVVTLPKGDYKTVRFVDNGKEVGKAEFGAKLSIGEEKP